MTLPELDSLQEDSTTVKELLFQEIDNIPSPLLTKVLNYIRYLKLQYEQDAADSYEARIALAGSKEEGTVSWEEVKAQAGL